MKKLVTALSAVTLLFGPAMSSASVLHIWTCSLIGDSTYEDLEKVSADWLEAARSMDGGADLRVYIDYPIAANAGFGEFSWALEAPDAATWGVFMNGYDESAAEEVDEAWNAVANCSSSGLWNSVEIGAE